MSFLRFSLLCSSLLVILAASKILDPKSYAPEDVIVTDVAIIGGGSAGTYAAINLQRMGQNIVLVERKKKLSGHTNTYTDHSTNLTVDYGVQAFMNTSTTLDYFAYMGVPLINYAGPNVTFQTADFTTGKPVQLNLSRDFTGWATQLARFPWLDSTWNVPLPVDPDLLLPLEKFLTK